MIALLVTADRIKFSAIESLLRGAGLDTEVFDAAAANLYAGVIPMRLMVDDSDLARSRRLLRDAGFVEAGDGEWDFLESHRTWAGTSAEVATKAAGRLAD